MIVFDASTLILLAKANLLDIVLHDSPGDITIPQAVETECVVLPSRTDARLIQERLREHRIAVSSVQDTAVVHRLITDFHLGRGEAEAIALALERHAHTVATDDRNAIRACKLLRLRFITAIGMLIRSAEKGLLREDESRRSLERLATYGRYQREILQDARRRLGGEDR
jgi:predicted nucleic acid-binding protein